MTFQRRTWLATTIACFAGLRPWNRCVAREEASVSRPAKFNKKLRIGAAAPDFSVTAVKDGAAVNLNSFSSAKILVLLFTSMRCPMSTKYRQRFVEFAAEYSDRGVTLLAVNVDTARSEAPGKIREKIRVQPVPWTWLHDGSQKVGRDYGAYVTPQVFVLDADRKVVYMGSWDDHLERAEVVKHYVVDAVEAVLAGRSVLVSESLPKGCEIEYTDAPKNNDDP